ncbi:MAG: YlbF family regulator [Clostridia bacterium]|nr:YlbF family regulator [Clostridia bacterium]
MADMNDKSAMIAPEAIAGDEAESEIFLLASQLGTAIKNDPRMVRFENAKRAYDADEELQKLLSEYDVQQTAMQQMAADPDRDTHLVDMVRARIDELYTAILARPTFGELLQAQSESSKLTEAVNNTISYMITGELPDCSHDCASCGGACHK